MNRRLGTGLWLAIGPQAATAIGFGLGQPWLLPILGAAVSYPVFLDRVRRGAFAAAFGWMLFWTVFQSLSVGVGMQVAPERAARSVHRGPSYAAEMLHWARTGEGAESDPSRFLPVHARHLAGFAVLTVVTAGAGGLILGTWLLDYMNYYVGSLTRASDQPLAAALLGWHPWAVLRVIGFIAIAVALAPLGLALLARLRRRPPPPGPLVARRFLALGLALVAADAVLKTVLAPTWQGILAGILS